MKYNKVINKYIVYIFICTINLYYKLNNMISGEMNLLNEEQLELVTNNFKLVFIAAVFIQLAISITLIFVETIVLCVIWKKTDSVRIKMQTFIEPVILGNIILLLYNIIFIQILNINTIEKLNALNLNPIGIIIKIAVIFLLINKKNLRRETSRKSQLYKFSLFFVFEYLYSIIGYIAL